MTSNFHMDIPYESLYDIMRTDEAQPGIAAFRKDPPKWFIRASENSPVIIEIGVAAFSLYGESGLTISTATLCLFIATGTYFDTTQHGRYSIRIKK